MNLVVNPWIPVVGTDGKSKLVSLADVFRTGEEIADLSANPCQRIALMRLLICITQAALDGPEDEDEWRDCRERIGEAGLRYLDKWRNRFNLFGDGAFLQVDGLEQTDNSLADKLDFSLAAGNNPTLFDHGSTPSGRVTQASVLALNLIVYQSFSPGGLIGSVQWSASATGTTSEHAPCLEGSMLHTYLRGDDLVETIHWNLITKKNVTELIGAEWGHPCWELRTMTAADLASLGHSYLGRLVPVPRCIRLVSGNAAITLGAGVKYQKLPEYREPAATVRKVKRGRDEVLAYLPVNPAKHVWRELGSILAMQDADARGGAVFLSHLRMLQNSSFDIWTGGIAADKAKLLDMCEWNISLPAEMLDTEFLTVYRKGVLSAETASRSLYASTKAFSEFLKSDAIWTQEGQRRFWTNVDAQCDFLIHCAASGQHDGTEWDAIVRAAMREAYERTCPHGTPRQIEAYAQGLQILDGWKGVFGEPTLG